MRRILAAAAASVTLMAAASAQDVALAPWFDSDGFYNRPGAALDRVSNDMTACRAEAVRLRTVRNTNSQVSGAAFTTSGAYDPVVAGAAAGIASILVAIQDARYNGSIEQIEFRDCAVALGYRHYRLGDRDRTRFNAEPDHGFAALVAAGAPADGRLNEGERERNYFDAATAANQYQNAEPLPPPAAVPVASVAEGEAPPAAAPTAVPVSTGIIARAAPGQTLSAQPGMAIVVIAASQDAGTMQIPMAGDTFRFTRVTAEGDFLALLQPGASFGVRSVIHVTAPIKFPPAVTC